MWHYFRGMVNHYKAEQASSMLSRIFTNPHFAFCAPPGVAVMVLIVGG